MESCSKSARESSSPFDSLLFDLDETLYSSKIGMAESLKKNIDDFLVERCGFAPDQTASLRVEFFKKYGNSLAALRALGYDVDADDYHSVVHGRLPYHLIKPDRQLRKLLRSTAQRKIIFTNTDRTHAIKALKRLGVEDCFDQIVSFETMNPNLSESTRPDEFPVVVKPSPEAMQIALRETGVDPRRTLFLDDSARNIAAGKAVGLRTALVGKTVKTKEADYALDTVNSLPKVVPEVWVNPAGGDQIINAARKTRSSLRLGREPRPRRHVAPSLLRRLLACTKPPHVPWYVISQYCAQSGQ